MSHFLRATSLHTTQCGTSIIFCFCLLIEPNAPPSNVAGHNASSTSIFVSWGEVPFLDQNGVIVSYTVTYRSLPSGPAETKKITAPASQTTLTGLNKYTSYSITVFASTSKAGGRESTSIVVITDEDSKFEFVIDYPLPAKRVPAASHRNTFILQ